MNACSLRLNVDCSLVTPTSANYAPPCWPIPDDFPIVVDHDGKVVSRYGDPVWDITLWRGRVGIFNFGDAPTRKRRSWLSPANSRLLRMVVAWWLYGERPPCRPNTLLTMFNLIRPLFLLCSERQIAASDLVRFPKVAEEIPSRIMRTGAGEVVRLLEDLHAVSDRTGFTLLDHEGLRRLKAATHRTEKKQTPYIPPRIWNYQATRLRAFLDDFNAHRGEIEACFRFCLAAYAAQEEAPGVARSGRKAGRLPFGARKTLGTFSDVARRFGVLDLLERWCRTPRRELNLVALGRYFTQVNFVGIAYLLNHSGMRLNEGTSLRTDCMQVEQDEKWGAIHLIRGETTKTLDDDEALWVTSPSAQVAVDALTCVARLRTEAAVSNPDATVTAEDIRNPFLCMRAYEPWCATQNVHLPLHVRHVHSKFRQWRDICPHLFDPDELKATEEDINLARLISPSLDADLYSVGKPWPLAWHQLRRTIAVNMTASGFVSEASLQMQLKHAKRAMSLYYAQGFSQRHLNVRTRDEYVRTAYEMLGKQLGGLKTDRYVSPLGQEHKANVLRPISDADHKSLMSAARQGRVSYRETLLGGCLKKGACPYGGIDNIVHCAGGDGRSPCPDALFDRTKQPAIQELSRVIELRLQEAPDGSPYRESLKAQQRSVENTLNVLSR